MFEETSYCYCINRRNDVVSIFAIFSSHNVLQLYCIADFLSLDAPPQLYPFWALRQCQMGFQIAKIAGQCGHFCRNGDITIRTPTEPLPEPDSSGRMEMFVTPQGTHWQRRFSSSLDFCPFLSLKSPSPSTLSPPKLRESRKDEDVFPHAPRSNVEGFIVELFMRPLKMQSIS